MGKNTKAVQQRKNVLVHLGLTKQFTKATDICTFPTVLGEKKSLQEIHKHFFSSKKNKVLCVYMPRMKVKKENLN